MKSGFKNVEIDCGQPTRDFNNYIEIEGNIQCWE